MSNPNSINLRLYEASVKRFTKPLDRHISITIYGIGLIQNTIVEYSPLFDEVVGHNKQWNYIFNSYYSTEKTSESLCYLIVSYLLDIAHQNTLSNDSSCAKSWQTMCSNLSNIIEAHVNYSKICTSKDVYNIYMSDRRTWSDSAPFVTSQLMKFCHSQKHLMPFVYISKDHKVLIGHMCATLLIELSGLVYEALDTRRIGRTYKTTKILKLNPSVIPNAHKILSNIGAMRPLLEPMVETSKTWVANDEGGHNNPLLCSRFVRHPKYLGDICYSMSNSRVVEVANILGQTQWHVNTQMVSTMELLKNYNLPKRILPMDRSFLEASMPEKPWLIRNEDPYPEELEEWKLKAKKVYNEFLSEESAAIRRCFNSKLDIAKRYSGYSSIYFPHNVDFRGRYYPLSSLLHPQSDDVSKSLLEFANGSLVTKDNLQWLLVHGANLYGYDKVSFEDRCSFMLKMSKDILRVAKDPLDTLDIWANENVDSPWQFLSFCFLFAKVLKDKEVYCHIPICLDGSNNGLQHYAAILRDSNAARRTNLINSFVPADIYTDVANVVRHMMEQDTEEKYKIHRDFWLGRSVTRKLVKRGTMTTPYGVSRFGIKEQLNNDFGSDDPDIFRHSLYLSRIIEKAIDTIVTSAKDGMVYLRAIANAYLTSGCILSWRTPLGFFAIQDYKKPRTKKISTYLGTKRIRINITDDTKSTVDIRKGIMAFAPNFIHSLDASHLGLTVLECYKQGIRDFCMIHDSYGTSLHNVSVLTRVLREQFASMYQMHNVFEELKIEYERRTNKTCDIAIPAQGSLDLNCVLSSNYFFG